MESIFKIKKLGNSTRRLSSIIQNKSKKKNLIHSKIRHYSLSKDIHQSYCQTTKNFKTMKINFFSEIINLKSKLKNDDFLSEKSTKKNLIEIFKFLLKSLNHLPGFESIIDYLFKSTIFFEKENNFENTHFEKSIKEFKNKITNSKSFLKTDQILENTNVCNIDNLLNSDINNFLDFKSICFKLKKDLKFIMEKYENLENTFFELKNDYEEMNFSYNDKIENKKNKFSKIKNDFLNLKKEKFFILKNYLKYFFKLKKNKNIIFELQQNLHELNELNFRQSENINNLREELFENNLLINNLKEKNIFFKNEKKNLEKYIKDLNKKIGIKNKSDYFIKNFFKELFFLKEKFKKQINDIFCNLKKEKIFSLFKMKNKKINFQNKNPRKFRNSLSINTDKNNKKIKNNDLFFKKKRFSIRNKKKTKKFFFKKNRTSFFETIYKNNGEKQKKDLLLIHDNIFQEIFIFIKNLCEINKIDTISNNN